MPVSSRGWPLGLMQEIGIVVWEGLGDVPGGGAGGEAREKKISNNYSIETKSSHALRISC